MVKMDIVILADLDPICKYVDLMFAAETMCQFPYVASLPHVGEPVVVYDECDFHN